MLEMSKLARLSKIGLYLAALLLIFLIPQARSSSPDVGLITNLTGEVSFWNSSDQKEPTPVQAFMKVRQGDQFKLSPRAQLQLLYCTSGRQETWTGPVIFSAGDQSGQVVGDKKARVNPEINIVPSKVSKRIMESPIPFPRSPIRYSGVIQTMTPGCPAPSPPPIPSEVRQQILKAQEVYRDLQKTAEPGDLTPELYLLSVYADYGQYDSMEQVIDVMREKQPRNVALQQLKTWAQNHSLKSADPATKR